MKKFGIVSWNANDVLGQEMGDSSRPLSDYGLTEEDAENILAGCEKYLIGRAVSQGWDTIDDQIREYLQERKPDIYKEVFGGA